MSLILMGRPMMRCVSFGLCLFAVLGLSACKADPPARTDLAFELYCDIGNSDCQRLIYDSVAEMLGAGEIAPPAIRTISVEQHAEEVRNGLDLEDLTGEDAESRGLRLLGFIPEASDSLAETQAEYWINQIAAYYSRRNHAITVIDRDYEEINAQTLLAHEFTHAIQQGQFDLDVVGADADTEDSWMGVSAVIEGDATHSSFAWAYDQLGYAPEEIDWDAIHKDRTDGSRADAADVEVALIDSASGFPYAYGFQFMTAATQFDGLVGRAAAFGAPPSTAAQVMVGYGEEFGNVSFPDIAHPSPVEGHTVAFENRFGAWYVYGFLRRRGMSDSDAWTTALNWVGDELAIYEDGDDVVTSWRVRFFESSNAGLVRDLINSEDRDVAWSALTYEDDLFVVAAETDETLLAWASGSFGDMSASVVPKGARHRAGAVSAGNCLQSRDFSLPNPPPLLH